MVYFTADMHFGHKAIITMQNRPFETVEEMNRIILDNYNSVVKKDDTVYIMGDLCHHMRVEEADDIIGRMNGKKYLVKGNHDKNYDPRLFADIKEYMMISTYGKCFVLMHYPMLSWPKKNSGSIHIHGHIHAKSDYNEANRAEGIKRFDVGVDANDFMPVSARKVIDFFCN